MAIDFPTILSSPAEVYAEGLRFFRGEGMINDVLKRLARDLESHGIDYSVIDAVALNQHDYRRFTEDIDLLLTTEGWEKFREHLVGLGYLPAFKDARKDARRKFRTTKENIPVKIITAGEFPGDGLPKPVAFPDPAEYSVVIEGIKTISLDKLIELKLTSGMTAGGRLKDLADVQELIKFKRLDESFAGNLNEFVREKYLELCRDVSGAKGAAEEREDV